MDIKQINSAIMFGTLTNTELNSIIDAVKFRRASMQKVARYTLQVGTPVSFVSTKTGQRVQGSIQKIAHKYATVSTNQGLWKVPMNMLETA
jgi:hypothetical protein